MARARPWRRPPRAGVGERHERREGPRGCERRPSWPSNRLARRRRRSRARDAAGLVRQSRCAHRCSPALRCGRRAHRPRAAVDGRQLRSRLVVHGLGHLRGLDRRPRGGSCARGRALRRDLRLAGSCAAQRADGDGHRHRDAGIVCRGAAHAGEACAGPRRRGRRSQFGLGVIPRERIAFDPASGEVRGDPEALSQAILRDGRLVPIDAARLIYSLPP